MQCLKHDARTMCLMYVVCDSDISVLLIPQTGENDFDVVPNSKFVVSRTAGRDNSSYYCVNGKRATWKEVAVLLRGNGIDLDHNRFLILQVCVISSSSKAKSTLILAVP